MQIEFIFDVEEKLLSTCHIIKKNYMTVESIFIVCKDENEMNNLDKLLWSFEDVSFIPHSIFGKSKKCKIMLSYYKYKTYESKYIDKKIENGLSWMVNLSESYPEQYSQFNRLIEIVSKKETDRLKARDRWRFYKKEGYNVKGVPLSITLS